MKTKCLIKTLLTSKRHPCLSYHWQYDADRAGCISQDEIDLVMMSTHMKSRHDIKSRAGTMTKAADTDNSGGSTTDELLVVASRILGICKQ